MLKGFSYSDRLVKPHHKIARPVEDADIARVRTEAEILFALCNTKVGIYKNALAMSHPQIDDQDPLRFFVNCTSQAIINPVIIRQTQYQVDSKEGCYSFPDKLPIIVPRSHKITVRCRVMLHPYTGDIGPEIEVECTGKDAFIFQHEMDHFEGKYIHAVE
jgi:peptide deformylase